jgi:hypothetical protein
MPAIELATSPQLHSHRHSPAFRRAPGIWLYRHGQPSAHAVKVVLQMIVGVGAVIDIGRHVAHAIAIRTVSSPLAPSTVVSVRIIAYALAVAAAIELAYTLFTPGPDEALDPLMFGFGIRDSATGHQRRPAGHPSVFWRAHGSICLGRAVLDPALLAS